MKKILVLTNLAHNIIHRRTFIKGTGNYSFYRSFRNIGNKVAFLSLDRKGYDLLYSMSKYLWNYLWYHVPPFLEKDESKFQKYMIENVKKIKPDMIFTVVGNRLRPETVSELSKLTKINVLWCGLDPEPVGWTNLISSVPYYTHIFTVDPNWIEKFKKWGAKNIFQQDLGVDEAFFKPINLTQREKKYYYNDINFVGQWDEGREEFFSQLADFNIGLWGRGWKEKVKKGSPLYDKTKKFVIGSEIAKIYNACKIVVNIHTPHTKYGINMRTFEAAGCGAFQIVDEKEGIFKLFDVGKEIVTFKNIDDLREKIRYYLQNEEERKKIAQNSMLRVLKDHKYSDLVGTVCHLFHL